MRPNISNCHALPGTLVIFEGADGSGKTTQIEILKKLLSNEGRKVKISNWKSSMVIGNFLSQNELLTKIDERVLPETNLFLQAADLLYRLEREVIPALKQNHIVIMDRGIETLLVRGRMIGMTEDQIKNGLLWWRNTIYKELFDKALTVHITVDLDTSLSRLRKRAEKYKSRRSLSKTARSEGTLLALDFIHTLVYSPEGKKMTRNDKKLFARKAQEKIIQAYNDIIVQNMSSAVLIDGLCPKKDIPGKLQRQIVDVLI